jgi:hypothetical protein
MTHIKDTTLVIADCVEVKRAEFAINKCLNKCSFDAVKFFTSLDTNCKYKVEIPRLSTLKAYSDFILGDIYKYVDTRYMLIIQHDGYILNADSWDNDFLNCDYIGAPWSRNRDCNVGNGGFSLRSKKLMEFVSKNYKQYQSHSHEDFTICLQMRKPIIDNGFKFSPIELAAKFSIDCNFNFPYDSTFGFHRIEALDKILLNRNRGNL